VIQRADLRLALENVHRSALDTPVVVRIRAALPRARHRPERQQGHTNRHSVA
jgi:hypothetical protein